MNIISIGNLKGGVGKTTICSNLAGALVERGRRVLLVDLDKQTNLTSTYAREDYNSDEGPGVYRALVNGLGFEEMIQETEIENLSLLPGEWDLILLDSQLANDPNAPYELADRLQQLDFDYVLIDTPPDLRLETRMALIASHGYLVPVNPDEYSYKGIVMLEREVERLRKKINPNIRCLGYVLNQVQSNRNLIDQNVALYRERFGERILQTEIKLSIKYPEARTHGLPITHYQPKSEWAERIRELTNEIDI